MTISRNLSILAEGVSASGVLAVTNGGTGVTTSTGTGSTVLSASPTLTGTLTVPTVTSATATALTIQSAGTTAVTIDTSQNVGIGTSSPSQILNVRKDQSSAQTQLLVENYGATNATAALRIATTNNHGAEYYVSSTGNAVLGTFTFTPLIFTTGNTEAMRIDSSGNVGIGTASPGYKIDISGSGDVARLTSSTTTSGMLMADSGGTIRVGTRSGAAIFDVGGSERMRIDSSGNVGIGATANASAILDAQSTTKGVRFPNMTTTQKNAISSPAAGLVVFDTTLAKLCVYSGSAWQTITSV